MKTQTALFTLRASILLMPLSLASCGGGSSPTNCAGIDAPICARVQTSSAITTASALFSTAPDVITLNAGAIANYSVGGGTPPYTTTSGNTNVGTASILGPTLLLTGIAAGAAPIVIVDSAGKAVNISLTVLAQGQQGTPLSIAPGLIITGNCTTNIPFFFTGGVAPYRLFTSNNFEVPISSALSSAGRPYFTASVRFNGLPPPYVPRLETLTVLDSQSRTATSSIQVTTFQQCPNDPLFVAVPETMNMRVTEIVAIQLSGGAPALNYPFHKFVFTDNQNTTATGTGTVVEVVPGSDTPTSFNIRALSSGRTMITVTDPADRQNVNITVSVF